jgi:hypothetical protein
LTDTIVVLADDFTIKNRVLHWQFPESDTQEEKVEMILIAGYQFAFVIFNISDCAEAVVFQFENVVRIVKGFCNALEAHRLDAGEQARNLVGGILPR